MIRYWYLHYKGVPIGKYTYGWDNITPFDMIGSIGAFTSIGKNILLVPNTHHIDYTTTSPILTNPSFGMMKNMEYKEKYPAKSIHIGNDVWIGSNVMIFQDVTIGDGAVIGAGAIVRRNVPPYAVVVNADKIIKYRFDENTRKMLMKLQWWNWEDDKLKKRINTFYEPEEFVNIFAKECK